MAVRQPTHRGSGFRLPSFRGNRAVSAPESAESAEAGTFTARAHVFASVRVLMGFVFLWAFLDKTFGFGYATASGKGWIDGGSPTEGFLALGMSADPGQLLPTLPAAAALALVTAITKVATGWYAAGRDGAGHRGRLRAGTALIARGEFSVVVIGLAATAQGRLGALVTGYVIILAVCGPILTRLASTRGAPPRKVASDGRAGTFSEPRTPSATSTPCPGRSAARSG